MTGLGRPIIYANVHIGEDVTIEPGVRVGVPPRGKQPGQLPTYIGAGSCIRSGTVIYAGVTLGERVNTGHGAMIRENNIIGDRSSVGTNAVLEPGNRVGNDTRIHSQCFMEHVTLGDRVFLGPGVVFTDDPHPMCPRFDECVLGATVEDDVAIGGNATILPGVRIGAGALIGAGAVVNRDVPAGTVAAGSPAKVIKKIEELTCSTGFFERPYIWREQRELQEEK